MTSQASRHRFCRFLQLMSCAFFGAGAMHLALGLNAEVLLGTNLSPNTIESPGLDSQNRFYGTCFMVYGVILLFAAADLARYAPILRAALWLVFAAGMARFLSVALYGWPPPLIGVLFALELSLPPVALYWLSRLLD